MRLFIAEKPSLGRAIAENLPGGPGKLENGYIRCGQDVVTWCFGHLFEQAPPEYYDPKYKNWSLDDLPILPERWAILVKPDAKAQYETIKKLLRDADEVVNAGDPDREGQLLVDELLEEAGYRKPVRRIWLSAVDPTSVRRALSNIKDNAEYASLKDSALARARADWLVGMNLSRAYTKAAEKHGWRGVISIGRVQTPTLAIVVQRDLEIESFVPKDYFNVRAKIRVSDGEFWALWEIPEDITGVDQDGRLIDKAVADQVVARVQGKIGTIIQYKVERKQEAPPLPFSLDALQEYASAHFGMGAQKVLDVCQSLYEKHQLTSYPRTDSRYLPCSQLADAPTILGHLRANFPVAMQAQPSMKSAAWDDSKVTAHHAIVPTAKSANMAQLDTFERQIYEAICLRYIAQFFPPRVYDAVRVVAGVEQDRFVATGTSQVSPGWRVVEPEERSAKDREGDAGVPEQKLPKIVEGESCQINPEVVCAKTRPPAHFTEGSLIRAMTNVHKFVQDPEIRKKLKEKDGLGTNATRAGIINTLLERRFLFKDGKHIKSTPAGRSLIAALPRSVCDPGLTAIWESALDKIASRQISIEQFMAAQVKSVSALVNQAKNIDVRIDSTAVDSSRSGPRKTGKTRKHGYRKTTGQGKATNQTINMTKSHGKRSHSWQDRGAR